jgi:hypothetical protein
MPIAFVEGHERGCGKQMFARSNPGRRLVLLRSLDEKRRT